jgi:hypothetical protein
MLLLMCRCNCLAAVQATLLQHVSTFMKRQLSCCSEMLQPLTTLAQLSNSCMLLLLQVGAGFYINATVDKWKNWRMYDYITKVGLAFCIFLSCTSNKLVNLVHVTARCVQRMMF